jgi:hypothetical protein
LSDWTIPDECDHVSWIADDQQSQIFLMCRKRDEFTTRNCWSHNQNLVGYQNCHSKGFLRLSGDICPRAICDVKFRKYLVSRWGIKIRFITNAT